MPVLHITKNDIHLCSVGSDDVWMFSASVHADIWGPACSELTVTGGGKRRSDGSFDFLIWEMAHALRKGDRIVFSFEEGSASSPRQPAIDDETPAEDMPTDLAASEEDITRLAARPKSNQDCRWRCVVSGEPEILVLPDDHRQNLDLHLLWNEMRAHRVRVGLSRSSLDEVVSRSGGEDVFLEYIEETARIELSIE
ncbi:hypothetical protein [Variovorax sp.]|jgi:hypothetical protein|uniref:hypothetical protein n=1 Tax=Variovorax sp. TaxID=1871043 RepID=UPI0037DA7908